MTVSRRAILLAIACLLVAGGAAALWRGSPLAWGWFVGAAAAATAALVARGTAPETPSIEDPLDMESLDEQRVRELVRGTSMHLRDMKYRYSVRLDPARTDRFTTVVNQVRLGFVPIVITDNFTDRQGLGYVAFPHDGRRWRGPGLPCPGAREDALRHAARCVEPLGDLEDTSDGSA